MEKERTREGEQLEVFYRRYNRRCNEHRFGELGEFVATDVRVNAGPQGLESYVAGLDAVVRAFPDYRWDLRHLLIEPPLIAAHFLDTGTHLGEFLGVSATGRSISTHEFAVYRVAAGRIAEVWVTADDMHPCRSCADRAAARPRTTSRVNVDAPGGCSHRRRLQSPLPVREWPVAGGPGTGRPRS